MHIYLTLIIVSPIFYGQFIKKQYNYTNMPIIKSAKKRVKQAEKRRQRNFPVRSSMKTHIKKVLLLAKEGKKQEAEKELPTAYKIIDTAAKKNIIHNNNAARKKSRLAKTVANIKEESAAKKTTSKVKTSKPKAAPKKAETKAKA
jgi:small subunit ribosomal protein S20